MRGLLRVLPYVREKHDGQFRKGADKVPYIYHPLLLGSNRAEGIMEQLEKLGVVDHSEFGRPRLIKVSLEKYEQVIRDIM